jgi:HEAT repeat protein
MGVATRSARAADVNAREDVIGPRRGGIMNRRCWLFLSIAVLSLSAVREAGSAPLENFGSALTQFAKELADQSLPVAQRVGVIRALGGWASPEARPPLIAALKDPSAEIRATAATALAWSGNREAVPALRALVEGADEPVQVRAAAFEAMGIIGDPATRPLLMTATKDPSAVIRQASLQSLSFGPLSEPADRVTYLIELAKDTALQGLPRCEALRELFGVKEERVVDALIRILENEPRFALALPEGGGSPQEIMEIRRIQARDVAAWAATGLGELKATKALPLLVRTAEDRSDFFLRLTSLRSVLLISPSEGRPLFLRRLVDPVPEVRMAALAALGELRDRTVVPTVLGRLVDIHSLVRAQAVQTLGMLGDPSVREDLEALQRREIDSNVLAAIDAALAQLPR